MEPYSAGVVLPHEQTHAGPKEGRLRLLRATRTILEPIFLLWEGAIDVDGLGEPEISAREGDVTATHVLWKYKGATPDAASLVTTKGLVFLATNVGVGVSGSAVVVGTTAGVCIGSMNHFGERRGRLVGSRSEPSPARSGAARRARARRRDK